MLIHAFGITTIISHSANRLFLLALLALIIFGSLSNERALAHVFVPDKNASLLALINQLKTELELIRYDLEDSNNNNSLASEHLADLIKIQSRNNISPFVIPELNELDELIKINFGQPVSKSYIDEKINNASKFLDEKIESKIDTRDLKNATVQALNIANITDEILREYAKAYDIEPVIARNTSSMLNMNIPNMSNMGSSMIADSSSLSSSMGMEKNNAQNSLTMDMSSTSDATKIVNISNYQNAQALAIKALEIFRQELKPLELSNATRAFTSAAIRTSSVSALEDGLSLLINSINEKKPYNDIMQIIHGPVHTDLFLAYDLKMIAY